VEGLRDLSQLRIEPPTAPPGHGFATLPNLLSALRLASVPVFVWLFLSGRENGAVVLFAVAAATDFFDGYLARRTDSVTRLGQVLDPLADRVFVVALAVALVAEGTLWWWLALSIVARDALVLGLFPVLERKGVERLEVNFAGKTATACLLFGLVWLSFTHTTFFLGDAGREGGITFTVAGAVLYWVAAVQYGMEAARRLRT
jgi:cardiolipin synthase (CMP-forming)